MAELTTHANFENIVNPDDLKLSKEYNENRLQNAEETATSRINDLTSNGGLDGFFDGLEDQRKLSPRRLSAAVRNQVLTVLRNTAIDLEMSGNGSSAGVLDTSLWKYRGQEVLHRINDVRRFSESSLSVIEIYKLSIDRAQAGVAEQLADLRNKQAESLENRNWWQKFGTKVLHVGTLGLRKTRSVAQEKSTNKLETQIEKHFKLLSENIAIIEKESTNRKQRMSKHIKRQLDSTHDINDKRRLRKQLIEAVRHTGDLSTIDLSEWETISGDPNWTDQERVDFLEAAKDLPELQGELAAMQQSESRNTSQTEMIDSAQAQQEIMKDKDNFRFDDLKKDSIFKDLDPAENAPSTTALVDDIEGKLRGNGIDLEKEIYKPAGDIGKADLMTDSARLVLLLTGIRKNTAKAKDAINKSIKTKQNILAWVKKIDGENGGDIESHDDTDVKDQLDILQINAGLISGNGMLKETAEKLKDAKSFDISDKSLDLKAKKSAFLKLSNDIDKKYLAFAKFEGEEDFPDKDFQLIKNIWEKVRNSRDFLINNIDQWIKDKEKYDEGETEKADREKAINNRLDDLNADDKNNNSIIYQRECLSILESTSPSPSKSVMESANRELDRRYKEKKELEKELREIKSKDGNSFTNLDNIKPHIKAMADEGATDYSKKITKTKSPATGSIDDRIQNFLATENFKTEINEKFLSNLAKNDQYELLKKCSEGTKVELTYKEVGASKNVDFPSDLKGSEPVNEFTIFRKDNNVIHLQNASQDKIISISNPAASTDGKNAYKNAIVRSSTGGSTNFTGGVGEHAIVYNMKITT